MTNRATFIARVREAAGRAVLPEDAPPPQVAAPVLRDVNALDEFRSQLTAVDGFSRVLPASDVNAAVADILSRHDASTVLMWDDRELPVDGLSAALGAAGIATIAIDAPRTGRAEHNDVYDTVDVGITGAEAGLVESGSIVVTSGPGRPRMASLVALVHIALLPLSRLHRSLTHYLLAEPDIDTGANLVVVTGPSRTGDIEQNLNLGVHGPRDLHVLVIEDR